MQKYFETEVKKNDMVGPLQSSPFSKIYFFPLLARDKSDVRVRVIVDLSWPLGKGINSCINSNYHDNIEFTLKYPTIDYLIQQLSQLLVHANSHFLSLKNILEELGLPINKAKSEPPSESITCLGIQINARTCILAIPSVKNVKN